MGWRDVIVGIVEYDPGITPEEVSSKLVYEHGTSKALADSEVESSIASGAVHVSEKNRCLYPVSKKDR